MSAPDRTEPPLLDVRGLSMSFSTGRGLLSGRRAHTVRAVRDVSFDIGAGETVGLVGESGSGKTTLGRCLLGLHRPTAGAIEYRPNGGPPVDLARLTRRQLRPYRQDVRMIFQDPNSSLNPRLTAAQVIAEPLLTGGGRLANVMDRVLDTMRLVGLRPDQAERYPYAFSGGERQRIGIARALITRPRLVVCDEAVTALDVSIRGQVLNLLKDLQEELGLTYLFISHDLTVIQHLCDRVAVMYLGEVVEQQPTGDLFRRPRHPYTESLLASLPVPDPRRRDDARPVPRGEVPDPAAQITGCPFHPRCQHAQDRCALEHPAPVALDEHRSASCLRVDELELLGVASAGTQTTPTKESR